MSYLEETFGLSGKTAAVTGGGGAIAGALSEALLHAGASVSLWDIEQKNADRAVERLSTATGAGERLQALEANAADESDVARALAKSEERFGRLDILVNCAGGNRGRGRFIDLDIAQFENVVRLNLVAGLVAPTKVIASHWIANGIKGAIINICSMASHVPVSGVFAYDAAKSAVLNLTMATAKEFAPYGIRVNALSPGFFIGKQNRALLIDETTGELTARGKSVIDHTPFLRFGKVEELAGALLFLASDRAAGFVTGITIPVDGGYLVHNV